MAIVPTVFFVNVGGIKLENKEFYINDDGIHIHTKLDFPKEKRQKYPLIIIIHGFTGHMEERHITAIAKAMNEIGYVSLRAEMYGHGTSGGQFCNHTLYKWISNAMAVVDYAKSLDFVESLYLCGHSQGGLLAMLVGAMEQDLFRAIIPLSPACSIPEGARNGELLGTLFDPEHIPEFLNIEDGRTLGGNYIRVAQMIDVESAIDRYKGPVLLIHGEQDTTIPVSYAYQSAERYCNAKLIIVPGDTHCFDYHLDMVVEIIKNFCLRETKKR